MEQTLPNCLVNFYAKSDVSFITAIHLLQRQNTFLMLSMYFILVTILICHSVLQAKMQSFLSQFEIKQIVYEAKTTKGC